MNFKVFEVILTKMQSQKISFQNQDEDDMITVTLNEEEKEVSESSKRLYRD